MKPHKQNKDDIIKLRVTKEEKHTIESLAKKANLTQSKFIRTCIFEKEIKFTSPPPEIRKYTSQHLIYYSAKASNNINQIAKALNILHKSNLMSTEKAHYYLDLLERIQDEYTHAIDMVTTSKC